MERTRVAGIVPMGDCFVFMHRKDVVKRKDYQEYYTFPGGRLEERRNTRRRYSKRNRRGIWYPCEGC